eukprot:187368_1
MGQPLSVITTLFVFSAVIHANCVDKKATQEEKCGENKTKPECHAKAEWCWWRGDDGYVPEPLSDSYSNVRTTTAADGTLRLEKDLPPLEAITEYIGDLVYYEQLRKHMPWATVYDGVLEKLTLDEVTITRAKDFNTEMPDEESAIIPLLTFSRPMLETKALIVDGPKVSIPLKALTLNNIVSIAHIAWWDALTMNDDRFAFHSYDEFNVGRINYSNMMLHTVDDRYVYVPIDQGFARVIVYSWYHDEHDMSEVWREQAFESWQEWYTEWVTKRMKALDFMNQNPPYFPKDMDDELKRKISAIIDIIWGVKGVVLCTDMGISIDAAFDDINDQGSRLESLLQGTGMWTPTELGFILVKDIINDQIKTCTSSKKSVAPLSWSDPMRTIEQTLNKNPHILVQEFTLPKEEELMKQWTSGSERSAMEVSAKQMQYNVGQDGDEQFDAPDQYYWNGFVIGGLLGGTSIVVIVLVFCIGLACGMLCCWGIQSIMVCRKIEDED